MAEHDANSLKEKAEVSEFLENAHPQEDLEFKRKEKRLVAKLDIYLAPLLGLLTLISFLDRGNIGYAASQGMAADIGLKGVQLNVLILGYSRLRNCHSHIFLDRNLDFLRFLHFG